MSRKRDLSYRDARREIQAGNLRHAYYIRGDEDYLKKDLADSLIREVVDERTKDFNYHVADAGELDPTDFASLLRTPPMMFGKRLFHLRDAQRMSPKVREIAIAFTEDPTPDVVLVMIDPRKWQDIPAAQRNPKYLQKMAAAGAAVVTCWSLFENDLLAWVKRSFERREMEVDEETARFFVEAVGEELVMLDAEIEKLTTYAAGSKAVTIGDIENVTGRYRGGTVFELAHLASEGKTSEALRVLRALSGLGEPSVRIVFWLFRHYLELGRLVVERSGRGGRGRSDRFGRKPREALRRQMAEAALHDEQSVRKALARIYDADVSIKKSGAQAEPVVEKLVLDLSFLAGRGEEP